MYHQEITPLSQQVTITTDAPVALMPLVESAIRSELRMLDLGLDRTRQWLRLFERQYALTSEEFAPRFATGEIAESLDFIEWAGEIMTYQLLKVRRRALQEAQLS